MREREREPAMATAVMSSNSMRTWGGAQELQYHRSTTRFPVVRTTSLNGMPLCCKPQCKPRLLQPGPFSVNASSEERGEAEGGITKEEATSSTTTSRTTSGKQQVRDF